MLFHISGPSSSGKTTIGKKLESIPNTFIIDTDEIDHLNAMEILSDKKYEHLYSNKNIIDGFWKMLEQKNLDKLSELLDNNKGKNIIIVGMTMYPPAETCVHGYSIDISSNDIFYQINKKSLNDICSNYKELLELLENEKNIYLIDLLILFKYKLNQGFPAIPDLINNSIEIRKKHDTELGYKYLKQEEIIKDIEKKILELNNLSRQNKLNKLKKLKKSKK
jgi:hypothetical protein